MINEICNDFLRDRCSWGSRCKRIHICRSVPRRSSSEGGLSESSKPCTTSTFFSDSHQAVLHAEDLKRIYAPVEKHTAAHKDRQENSVLPVVRLPPSGKHTANSAGVLPEDQVCTFHSLSSLSREITSTACRNLNFH